MAYLISSLALIFLLAGSPSWSLQPGDLAPGIRLYNVDTEEDVSLEDYLGKDVVLMWAWAHPA